MIEFYCKDCVEALKEYPAKYFDLAIVDPPYGANDAIGVKDCKSYEAQRDTSNAKQLTHRKEYHSFNNTAPDDSYFRELYRVSKNQIIWGANFFGIRGGYICWDKKGSLFGRAELAYCSKIMSVNVFEYTWNGFLQGDMQDKEIRIHPTQKPVALYKWLLTNYANKGDKILDTHVGSASSLIACYELGFDAVGFEIDETYYKQAQERLKAVMSQVTIFDLIGGSNNG